ncbi:MAG: hypothetical protein QXV84_03310 [Conexivisphaerales archaeon]
MHERLEKVKEEIEGILQNLSKEDPDTKYETKFPEQVELSEINGSTISFDEAFKSLVEVSKEINIPTGFEATCDAYCFNSIAKIPKIIFDPRSINDIHKPDE